MGEPDVVPRAGAPLMCPPAVRRGDRVALVAPASPPQPEHTEAARALLESWGLSVVLGAHVGRRDRYASYLAGSDKERAADLQEAWLDPSIRAVVCLRGGYGSMRVIDHLDFAGMAAAGPKLLVGSSDITALHQAWAVHLGLTTLFAPMPATTDLLDDPDATASLHRGMFEFGEGQTLAGAEAEEMIPGTAEGPIVGGNLSLIAAAVGAPEWRVPVGGIGLLEEVHEEPYRLDLLLLALKRSGWLAGLDGLALGSWEDCGDPAAVKEVLRAYVTPLDVPVVWQLGFGHCRGALSIPLGADGVITTDPPGLTIKSQSRGRQI
jgi:muramoyltetrapeptide carboxypeptidase